MRTTYGVALALLGPLLPLGIAPAHAVVDAPRAAPTVTTGSASLGEERAVQRRVPRLRVRTVVRGLQHPWDVQQAPGGRLLVSERDRARISVVRRGKRRTVANLSGLVWVSGETGLMSMAVDRDRRILWACHGARTGSGHEVRVTRWRVSPSWRRLSHRRTVVSGLPSTSGRHGGCRLLLERRTQALLVGTGDAAVGTNPRDLDSLGGKVLRVHRMTGAPMPDNPYAGSEGARRLVLTHGHRNVQGLAQRRDGSLWSVEHGSSRDDEVNLLVAGGDYGWHPVPGYNESVPMTDHSLPGRQRAARWSSGSPTVATSGAAWVRGRRWGALQGTLAVAALKGSRVLFMKFDRDGRLVRVRQPAVLRRFGRLRSVTSATNGDLLVTTANGSRDRILRISPARRR